MCFVAQFLYAAAYQQLCLQIFIACKVYSCFCYAALIKGVAIT